MSRIETSCTESNTSDLYTRHLSGNRTSRQSRQTRTATAAQKIAPTNVTLSTLQQPRENTSPAVASDVYSAAGRTEAQPARVKDEAVAVVAVAVPSEPVLMTQLLQADARINELLQRQPDFRLVISSAFRETLRTAFPDVRHALDPDHIYVTEYVDQTVVLSGDNNVKERRPTSSATLSQALQNAIQNGYAKDYDIQKTGFFYAPGNAVNNPDEVVQGMHTAQHVTIFEAILRSFVALSASNYQQAIKNFWDQPDPQHATQLSPKAQLIASYRQQRQTEARLRTDDATLSATGKRLLDQVYAVAPSGSTQNRPGVFRLALHENGSAGPISFAGILLVTRSSTDRPDTTSGPVLLVMPGQGLIEFPSAPACRDTMLAWLEQRDQRALLLSYVDNGDNELATRISNLMVQRSTNQTASFRYDAVTDPALTGSIQSRLDRQQRDIALAINSAQKEYRAPDGALRDAIDLQTVFDIKSFQDTRQQLLTEGFLKNANADERKNWRAELQQYQSVLKKTQTGGLPSMRQYLDPAFLHTYASDKVRAQVKRDLGFNVDPDQLIVTTQDYIEHKPPIPANTTIRKVPFHRTLTALSLANTNQLGDVDWNEVAVKDGDGYKVPQMTHEYLSRLLRTVNIGQNYRELLQAHLLDSAEGLAREEQYMQFLNARLRLDSREAKIRGDITENSMRDVFAILENTPLFKNGKALQARQLSIGGNPLPGIFLFGTNAPVLARQAPQFLPISSAYNTHTLRPDTPFTGTGISKVIVYIPEAPDGKRLHEFASREEMKQAFIRNSALRNYLLQHAALSRQTTTAASLDNGEVDDSVIAGNFLQTSYRTQAQKIIIDADAKTTSNAEDDSHKRWEQMNLALDIAGIFLPPQVTIPLSLIRATVAFSSISQAIKNDHKEDAWQAFFEGLSHLSGAALDSVGSSIGPSSRLHKSGRQSSGTRISPALTPQSPPAPSVTPTGMTPVRIDGKTYYFWQSARNTLVYRNLFENDPHHPGQLKPAGYGVPDTNHGWKKIDLQHFGHAQNRVPATSPYMTEATLNSEVARLIQKVPSPVGGIEYFSSNISGQTRRLIYNLKQNDFTEANSWRGSRYFPRYNEMITLNPLVIRGATDIEREATLRALGINLTLPLGLPVAAATDATPIPRTIHSVWVGGEIPASRRDAILTSLENNASMASRGANPYEMKLYLSNRDPAAHARNLDHLRTRAPSVPVVVLEDTPFYQTFKQSKYFNQYLAAIDGNGGLANNYASAADVLRYRLLHHEGGLYLDCDDTLIAPPGSIDIKTTPNGLALDDPVSNVLLGMDMQYNTSIFGSHKNNLTLDAISEESYQRFSRAPGLYISPRPRRFTQAQRMAVTRDIETANEQKLYAYMQRISYVTGPNVFNKVIDEQLPELRQIREAVKLKAHSWNFNLPQRMKTDIDAAAATALPLGKINRMGNAHTWDETRR